MARRLNTFVHVHVDGVSTAYGPGDDVPGAVADLITNTDVWDEDPAAAPPATGEDLAKPSGIPPKSGKGSDLAAWRAYADANGFETDDDVTREEIIAGLEASGIPTGQ